MKAAVLYQTNKPLIIEEIDIDELGPGWVKAKTVSAAVCHSGRHRVDGRTPPELIGFTYPLEEINDAFATMKAGAVARSVITF